MVFSSTISTAFSGSIT
uniref:Uncharacterized protein n=1 Tax=Arundo donax TaxID=35708 RepID=A0A0A9CCV6_ARUDO